MKRVFLLMVVPAMLVALGFAQTPAASGNTDQVNIKGCLGGSEGSYTVAEDSTGKIFKITTSSADLKAYSGQEVNLVAHKAGTAENSVTITGVNMISEHCNAAAAAPAASVSAPTETISTPAAAAAAPPHLPRLHRLRLSVRRPRRSAHLLRLPPHLPQLHRLRLSVRRPRLSARLLRLPPHLPQLHRLRLSVRRPRRSAHLLRLPPHLPRLRRLRLSSYLRKAHPFTKRGRQHELGKRQQRPLPRQHPLSPSAHRSRTRLYLPRLYLPRQLVRLRRLPVPLPRLLQFLRRLRAGPH